jgi:hypothetical protein
MAEVHVQHLDADGQALWSESGLAIAQNLGDPSNHPINFASAPDGAGGLIIGWYARPENQSTGTIYLQRLAPNGTPLWQAGGVPLAQTRINYWLNAVVPDGAGGAITAWNDCDDLTRELAQHVSAAGTVTWNPGGNLLRDVNGTSYFSVLCSDGAGGIIGAWGTSAGTFVQRMDASGNCRWPVQGIYVFDSIDLSNQMVPDGSGGAILMLNSGLAQRIDADGELLWGTGVELCGRRKSSYIITAFPDGSGGAFLGWLRRGYVYIYYHDRVFAQHVDSNGNVQWGRSGVEVCTQGFSQDPGTGTPDGRGGAIFTLTNARKGFGPADVYTQRIDSRGRRMWGNHGTKVAASPPGTYSPHACTDAKGGAVVAWEYFGDWNLGSQLAANHVSFDGDLGN